MSEEQIANNMGISRSTLSDWKKNYPDILNALKKGKEVVDFEIENALAKSALEGNVTAQIFWLKNRKPDKWKDKPAVSDSGIIEKLDKVIGDIDAIANE